MMSNTACFLAWPMKNCARAAKRRRFSCSGSGEGGRGWSGGRGTRSGGNGYISRVKGAKSEGVVAACWLAAYARKRSRRGAYGQEESDGKQLPCKSRTLWVAA